MEKMIEKRDGRLVEFDKSKIEQAVLKCFKSVDGQITDFAEQKAKNIADYIETYPTDHILSVEEIQDLVEKGLMSCKRKDVARAYITYRNERTRIRNQNEKLMQIVKEKLDASNVVNQNANIDEKSFGGRRGEASNEIMKQYALDNIVSELSRTNHLENMIYIHDLDSYAIGMHNCLTIPFDDLLKTGFNTRQTDVRPAGSLNTAFQLVAVIFQLQSLQQFGGVSASHLDWTMVPYVRKSLMKQYIANYLKDSDDFESLDLLNMYFDTYCDESGVERNRFEDWVDSHKEECLTKLNLTNDDFYIGSDKLDKKLYNKALYDTLIELRQAVEGMYHNLNTLQSRSGNQLPFTSINYGTCTLPEGRMVTQALIEGSIKGVGKIRKTPIFPCGIFQCMKGVNRAPGDPNYNLYKLALQSTAKRLYPNYANVDWSVNVGYDKNDPETFVSTMGCRTYNGADINAEPGVNPQRKDGRGNIAPVTIILPTLAMMANSVSGDTVDNFMDLLDRKLFEAKDMLLERYEYICSQSPESAKFMYENGTMRGFDGKTVESAMKHGTLVIGQLGLAETLQILIGTDQTTEKGMQLAKAIEALFKKRCAEFKQNYHLNFGVYYTPAENLCYTAMKKFKAQYGEIPNVSDKEYFTNSIHVPVWKQLSPFEKIDIESQLTGYSNAGCITYVELESTVTENLDVLETLVNYAMDKDIPYFAINVPNDTCLDCGFTGEFNDECPVCHSKNIQQLRRVTGYLTGNYKTAFNKGKQAEVEDRVKHSESLTGWKR